MTENSAPENQRYCPLMTATMPEAGVLARRGASKRCQPGCAWRVGEECAVAVIAKKLTTG